MLPVGATCAWLRLVILGLQKFEKLKPKTYLTIFMNL